MLGHFVFKRVKACGALIELIKYQRSKNFKKILRIIYSEYGKIIFEALNGGNEQCTKLNKLLDKYEFTEYTENKGKWDPSLIPEESFITLTSCDLVFNYSAPEKMLIIKNILKEKLLQKEMKKEKVVMKI